MRKEYEGLSATFRNLIYYIGLYVFHTTRIFYRLKSGV
jgi:hypothetical protein